MKPTPQRRRHLASSSGAFDLPSILVGVVVVGILTAGVLAAIFGVIPFAQDNAAKQDLTAINTAQGVAYAKDGQVYKDLAGLEDADLVSGLDPGKAEVTASEAGKGFKAIVTAGNGNRWMITHDNPEPRRVDDSIQASGFCTAEVIAEVEFIISIYSHPGVIEMIKAESEQPYDEALFMEFMDLFLSGSGQELTDEQALDALWDAERYVMQQVTGNTELEMVLSIGATGKDSLKEFCASYQGPVPGFNSALDDPKFPEAPRYHGVTGSTAPIVMHLALDYGVPEDFSFTLGNTGSIPGLQSVSQRSGIIDGNPYQIVTLVPGPSGWGDSAQLHEVAISLTRKNGDASTANTGESLIRVNSNTINIKDPVLYEGGDHVRGGTWDNYVEHHGQRSNSGEFAFKWDGSGAELESSVVKVEDSGVGADVSISYPYVSTGVVHIGWPNNVIGSASAEVAFFDPLTFARTSHTFTRTIVQSFHVPDLKAPNYHLYSWYINSDGVPPIQDDHYIDVPINLERLYSYDFDLVVNYAGLTCGMSETCTFPLGNGQTGTVEAYYIYLWTDDPSVRVIVSVPDGVDLPRDLELDVKYRPSGESSAVKFTIPD